MNATFPNITLHEELVTLIQLRISKDYLARHPATDPRLAIEAEADRAALDLKIADLTAKTQDAKILPFPIQGGGGPTRKAGLSRRKLSMRRPTTL